MTVVVDVFKEFFHYLGDTHSTMYGVKVFKATIYFLVVPILYSGQGIILVWQTTKVSKKTVEAS